METRRGGTDLNVTLRSLKLYFRTQQKRCTGGLLSPRDVHELRVPGTVAGRRMFPAKHKKNFFF